MRRNDHTLTDDSRQQLLGLAKGILKAVHDDFREHHRDDSEHIPRVRKIILAVQDQLEDEHGNVEEVLKAYAFQLYRELWLAQAKKFEDSFDPDKEREEAKRAFFAIYDQADNAGEESYN